MDRSKGEWVEWSGVCRSGAGRHGLGGVNGVAGMGRVNWNRREKTKLSRAE